MGAYECQIWRDEQRSSIKENVVRTGKEGLKKEPIRMFQFLKTYQERAGGIQKPKGEKGVRRS